MTLLNGAYVRLLLVALAASLAILSGVAEASTANPRQSPQVSTPSMSPATFDESVTDYVVRCQPANQVQMTVSTPEDTKVSVDGGPQRKGSFTQGVSLSAGQSFNIIFSKGYDSRTYYFRCLPSDFPAFTAQRLGTPQAQWYVVAPALGAVPAGESNEYVAIFDTYGVPVWWMHLSQPPWDAKLLPNGDLAWMFPETYGEERTLDGTLVRTMHTVGGTEDSHDVQLLSNGDYLMVNYIDLPGQDLTPCGGATDQTVRDPQIQEITPAGTLVWSWTASNHIAYSEVSPPWRTQCSSWAPSHDLYHLNSIEPVGSDLVVSFRHLDAVYKILRPSGEIAWKLGGTARPESLSVIGDPVGDPLLFGGQHDARVLSDGSLTLHDNGTNHGRAPRAVRYWIDESARTATFAEQVSDPDAPSSGCCGGARKLPGGDWVMSWGGGNFVTELTASGTRVFKLTFTGGLISYRVDPVLPGRLSRSALRAGMDAQHPRKP